MARKQKIDCVTWSTALRGIMRGAQDSQRAQQVVLKMHAAITDLRWSAWESRDFDMQGGADMRWMDDTGIVEWEAD